MRTDPAWRHPAERRPAYWRVRYKIIADLLRSIPATRDMKKNAPRSLLYSYGYISPVLVKNSQYESEQHWIEHYLEKDPGIHPDRPLDFIELTSANTWFEMHPEKVAGTEQITTSIHFPITIIGSKADIVNTIRKGLQPSGQALPDKKRALMKMKLKLAKAKLLLEQEGARLSGLGHLMGGGVGGLGALGEKLSADIEQNASRIEALLKVDSRFKKKLTFEGTIRIYNQGITEDEIKAWVWYKRSLGFPMHGWNKYYLKGIVSSDLAYAARTTLIKDNHFRDLETIKAGRILGKATRFTNEYDQVIWRVVTMQDNSKVYVRDSDIRIEKGTSTASQEELDRLVKKGALCYENGQLVPVPVYLFGNMGEKQAQLQKDTNEITERYGADQVTLQEEMIRKAKPNLLSILNQDARDRPIITTVSRFAKEFTIKQVREEYGDTEAAREYKKVNGKVTDKARKEQTYLKFDGEKEYSLLTVFMKWLFTLTNQHFESSNAIDIVSYYLKNRPLKDDEKTEAEKKQLKADAREEGERLFQVFLNEVLTFEDQQRLDYLWNLQYNSEADIQYHKVPIGFECSGTFKKAALEISPVQRQGVAFMEIANSGICAFDVGVGKTMTAIITFANTLYSRRGKRILLVVPNAVYDKWIRELFGEKDSKGDYVVYGVLSGTDYTLNDWYNLGTEVAKKLTLDQPVAEKSITMITFEGLNKIGFSEKLESEMLSELSKIILQSDEAEDWQTIMNEARNKGKKPASARDKEKKNQALRSMIGEAMAETICDYDTLGFDFVTVDEAHNFKNVFANVSSDEEGNKRYNLQSAVSKRAVKAFFLCNYIQRKFRGNVMLLTATPFTNSPLEVYSMLSLVAYHSLVRQNILNIREFFDQFIIPTVEWAVSVEGKLQEREIIKNFINRLTLQKLIHNHIIYRTGEDANVPRPCKINLPRMYERVGGTVKKLKPSQQVLTYLKMNALQAEQQQRIVDAIGTARAIGLQKGAGKAILFQAMAASLNNAMSPFLIKSSLTPEIIQETGKQAIDYQIFVEYSPKIDYALQCIASVKKWHESRGETASGQVIYANRGKEFFPFIKEYLEKETGYKKAVKWERKDASGKVVGKYTLDEVEILTGEVTENKRENIKDAFLDGTVKIIIGTATIREGIDLQKRGTVIYDLLPEWNPTDIRQLEGRIWRQGNDFGYVRFVMPLVQDSMDVFIFQKLEEKSARINDLWFKADRGNVLDLESLDPEEIKYALITDLNQIAKMMLEKEREEHKRGIKIIEENIKVLKAVAYDLQNYTHYRTESLKVIHAVNNNLDRQLIYQRNLYEQMQPEYKSERERKKNAIDFLVELKAELADYLSDAAPEDKRIVGFKRKFQKWAELAGSSFNSWAFSYFAEYLSKVKKAERSVLQPKGYKLTDDLKKITEEFQAELDKQQGLVSYYENDGQRSKELLKEAEVKKSSLQIDGKTVTQRAEDFASLNYLLAYQYSRDRTTCELPSPTDQPPGSHSGTSHAAPDRPPMPTDKQRQLIKLKLRLAKAKLLLEEELQQTGLPQAS